MRRFATTTLFLLLMSLGLGSRADAQVSFNLRIGPPPVPRVAYYVPPRPAPGYVWISGYWYPQRGHYVWQNGYWARPPYAGAYWVAPRYSGNVYISGRWEGRRGYYGGYRYR